MGAIPTGHPNLQIRDHLYLPTLCVLVEIFVCTLSAANLVEWSSDLRQHLGKVSAPSNGVRRFESYFHRHFEEIICRNFCVARRCLVVAGIMVVTVVLQKRFNQFLLLVRKKKQIFVKKLKNNWKINPNQVRDLFAKETVAPKGVCQFESDIFLRRAGCMAQTPV